MRSLKSRLFYWFMRVRRSPLDPRTSLAQQREAMEKELSRLPTPKGVSIETVMAGGRPAEWMRPPDARGDRTVLYLHGGGYTLGSCRTHRTVTAGIALAAKCPALVLEYRLAPEHPFPAALDDAVAAFRWLVDQGFEPGRIALAGDSAGGGLAVSTALALRDQGGPSPGALLCFSPWIDLTISGESCTTKAKVDPIVSSEALVLHVAAYTAGEDPRNPLISPLFADLQGLPPLLIQVGTAETLLSDSLRLADAAAQAGVEVTLQTWDGMWHVWQAMNAVVPEGRWALQSAASFFEQCLR